jgi:3-phosphoshikimate 1-carboxyvinyltransferase
MPNLEIEIELSAEFNSKPYVDMTICHHERLWSSKFNAKVTNLCYPTCHLPLTTHHLPHRKSDASAASYFFAAPAICGGTVKVENISRNSLQGDIRFP